MFPPYKIAKPVYGTCQIISENSGVIGAKTDTEGILKTLPAMKLIPKPREKGYILVIHIRKHKTVFSKGIYPPVNDEPEHHQKREDKGQKQDI